MSVSALLSSINNPANLETAKQNLVVAGKVTAVALVIGGLVAATVFSFGAAGAAYGAAVAGGGGVKLVVSGTLYGAALGTSMSTVLVAVPIADLTHMYSYHEGNNLADIAKFIACSLVVSAGFTGFCAQAGGRIAANNLWLII